MLEEQKRQNTKLESLLYAGSDKLNFVQRQKDGQQVERDTLQLQLDEEMRQIREVNEEKKELEKLQEIEMNQNKQNH